MTGRITVTEPGRVRVELEAIGSTDAQDKAKRLARDAGYRIRTVARVQGPSFEMSPQPWIVELSVRP